MKKKVLVISESSVFSDLEMNLIVRGGGASCLHNVASTFVDLNCDVDFFALREFSEQKEEETIDGVNYFRLVKSSRSSFKLIKFLIYAYKKSKNYDYVVLNQFLPHLLLPFLRKKKTLAVVHDVYMSDKSFWFKRFSFFVALVGFFVEYLQIHLDKYFATKIMAVSNSTKNKLIKKIGEKSINKIFVNPYPVDSSDYLKKSDISFFNDDDFLMKENYLLFVGRFVSYKQPEHLLKILREVKEKYPLLRIKFVVTREFKNFLEEFKNKVFDMNLSDKVDFYYSVSVQKLKELYVGALVLVHPSVMEGQGIVILEALASGTPVLAYDLDAYDGMLLSGKNSELVELNNLDLMVEGLYRILGNYEYYQKNTLLTLNEFSKKKFSDNLESNFFI